MNSHYFPHDYSARNDQKILSLRYKFPEFGYGTWWMILETMAEDTTGFINREAIGGLSLGYGVPMDTLLKILDFCVENGLLSICEHGNYYNKRMQEHKSEMTDYSMWGKQGAAKRWKNQSLNSPPNSHPNSPANAIKGKEIKEEKTAVITAPRKEQAHERQIREAKEAIEREKNGLSAAN